MCSERQVFNVIVVFVLSIVLQFHSLIGHTYLLSVKDTQAQPGQLSQTNTNTAEG